MSKYKAGDKVVMEITDKFKNAYDHEYYSVLDSLYSTDFIDEKTEPLTTYTEPLEAKIRRQAAEIKRLLAENKRLKAENGNSLWNIEQARAEGQNEAWELARKCMLMTDREREAIFGSGHNALYGALTYFDYKHAAEKVTEWKEVKEEVNVGDIVRDKYNTSSKFCVTQIDYCDGHLYGIGRYGLTYSNQDPKNWEKTGRHMDIDSFLKQIGEE